MTRQGRVGVDRPTVSGAPVLSRRAPRSTPKPRRPPICGGCGVNTVQALRRLSGLS